MISIAISLCGRCGAKERASPFASVNLALVLMKTHRDHEISIVKLIAKCECRGLDIFEKMFFPIISNLLSCKNHILCQILNVDDSYSGHASTQ